MVDGSHRVETAARVEGEKLSYQVERGLWCARYKLSEALLSDAWQRGDGGSGLVAVEGAEILLGGKPRHLEDALQLISVGRAGQKDLRRRQDR